MKKLIFLVITYAIVFFGSACNKDKDYSQIDEDIIQQYINDNNLSAESTLSGLYYIINNQGSGELPTLSSTVTVAYTGKLTDGTIFDQSDPIGATFPLTNVIRGWQEGIPLFNEGGSGKLLIPSGLGYGNQAVGGIPANSVLIFDVHLINVN